jgi:hypothetical protein
VVTEWIAEIVMLVVLHGCGRGVETVNVAVRLPAGTCTTTPGYATLLFDVCRSTSIPGAGATSVRVTVPVEEFEPMIEIGLSVTELNVTFAGCSVIVCELLTPVESVAVTTTAV